MTIILSSLLNFNGTDASTTFTDVSGKTWTAAGNAQLDTAANGFKFGTAGGLFDGTGDVITTPDSTDFDFGSGDFTIECWARFNSVGASLSSLIVRGAGSSSTTSILLLRDTAALQLFASSNGSSWDIANGKALGTVAADGTWYHIAITRISGTWHGYLQGVEQAGFPFTNSSALCVKTGMGVGGNPAGTQSFNGWLDDVRIIKGYAFYTAAFTPPTAELTGFGFFDQTLPLKTLDSSGITSVVGNASGTLPLKIVNFYSEADLTLPMKALSASSITGVIGTASAFLPLQTLSATGITGGASNASVTLPMKTLDAHGASVADLLMPMKLLVATSLSGVVGTADNILPIKTVAGTGYGNIIGNANFTLPMKVVGAVGLVGGAGTAANTLPLKILSAPGFSGLVGNTSLVMPMIELGAKGYSSVSGTANLVLPLFQLDASGYASIVENYRTWVLNTRKGALTEYSGFTFNSFCTYQGQVLAAGSSGIVVLGTQDLDNATVITARVRSGKDSFGSSYHKRIPRAYIGYTPAGDAYFRMITPEGGTRTYILSWNHGTDLQQRRIPIGKGPKSRYWQWEFENVAGADFGVDNVMLYPTKLHRRV